MKTARLNLQVFLPLQWPTILFLIFTSFFCSSLADIGTAAYYSPPYSPCYGGDPGQFPPSNFFAAAGEGIWDNGAACGRQYLVRCISAITPETCVIDLTIQILIVDYAAGEPSFPSAPNKTMVLSDTAFAAIANLTASSVNIEFQQV